MEATVRRLARHAAVGFIVLGEGVPDEMDPRQEEITGHMDVTHIAAAGVTALTLYVVGIMCQRLFGLPAPVAMLFIAVVVKLTVLTFFIVVAFVNFKADNLTPVVDSITSRV